MEDRLLKQINDYNNECNDNYNDIQCLFRRHTILRNIEMYHIAKQLDYNNCLLRVCDCKRKSYSNILDSFTLLPTCLRQEEKCIDDATRDLNFVRVCYNKMKTQNIVNSK